MLSPLLPDLLAGLRATPEEAATISKGIISLQTMALIVSIPPTAATLRMSFTSENPAQQFAKTGHALIHKAAPNLATALQFTANGSVVLHQANDAQQMTATMDCVAQLLSPARLSAKQSQRVNSLRQIVLGMHNFHDVNGYFPSHALSSNDGKKLLSWRVLILPYIDHAKLYKKFRLDEPWNSEHNIRLVDEIPFAYSNVIPEQGKSDGKTRMQAPLHASSVFGQKDGGTQIRKITDGTSNTLMVVQVPESKAVSWTKPDDLVINDTDIKSLLIDADTDSFLACLCDGAARNFSS